MVIPESLPSSNKHQIKAMPNVKKKSSIVNPPILSEKYLDGAKSKNDLVHRLQNVIEALSDESIDPSYSGLDGLALRLVAVNEEKNDGLLRHKDKEVRLYTVMACLEIFAIYAPEPPFDPEEVFEIFSQLIAQLGNLSHTTLETQPNYHNYFSILEHLSQVRTGIVLVEYCRGYSGPLATTNGDHEDDDHVAQRALELLTDLIRIILESIQNEHSSEVRQHAVTAIAACIGEFQHTIPICILDVLLSCISRGPKVWVHPAVRQLVNGEIVSANNKAAKRNTAAQSTTAAAPQLEKVDNISYRIAAKVIEMTKDKCSTPIATLLNGILNGESFALSQSSISADDHITDNAPSSATKTRSATTQDDTSQAVPNVWSIVYEMHRIAPDILTTVIGTIASNLRSEEKNMRLRVVKLLGKLFYSPKSMIALRFISCYREWCHRSKDLDVEIRSSVLSSIIQTLDTYASEDVAASKELREVSISTLEATVQSDPDAGIREAAIQQICELCLTRPEIIPPSLLHAVSDRVKGKHTSKAERKYALTGLAQLYHIHYLHKKLLPVEQYEMDNGGDFDDLQCISEVLSTARGKTSMSKRINRVVQKDDDLCYRSPAQVEEQFYWIPEIVMECAWYTDHIDSEMRNRVIQIVDDILLGPADDIEGESSESVRIMKLSSTSRALGLTLILNSFVVSDEQQHVEETNAYKWLSSLLVQRASLQAAVSAYIDARGLIKNHAADSVEAMKANAAALSALEKVLAFTPIPINEKDKLLKSLHGARDRHLFRVLAMIATPMHSKASRSRAFHDLPQRAKQCSFSKTEIAWLKTCARRCAMGSIDIELADHLILLVKLCVKSVGAGGSDAKTYMHNAGCLMRTLKLVCKAFPKLATVGFSHLQEIFLVLRSRKKESRRSAPKEFEVSAMPILVNVLEVIALAIPHLDDQNLDPSFEKELILICTCDQSFDFIKLAIQILSSTTSKDRFGELLKIYSDVHTLSYGDARLTTVLSGLSVLCECFPDQWRDTLKTVEIDAIVNFAFHKILLLEDRQAASDSEESPASRCTPNSCSSGSTRRTPRNKASAINIASMICASMELLCSHIRSIHNVDSSDAATFSDEGPIIQCMLKIFQKKGTLDTWSASKVMFRSTPDLSSSIRRTAALSLFRMIGDVALKLEDKYPSIDLWHSIANSLLDEESDVRSILIKEWIQAVSGSRMYCHGKKFAPSLRFLAMGIYCVDGEHLYPMANGFAGNVNSLCATAKEAALQCIVALRRTCQIVEAQCAALGPEGVANFERRLKMKIMPEFTVPFLFHLLSHRPETPTIYTGGDVDDEFILGKKSSAGEDVVSGKDEDGDFSSKEYIKARVRQLKKRLLWLFEPLVVSLGDSGDNISFLLRMSELIGKNFHPVLASTAYDSTDTSKRLGVVCLAARDVLLKFVKKDADLSHYSGPIQIPTTLFVKKTDFSACKDNPKQRRERASVSFADEVQNKMMRNDKEDGQFDAFDEPIHHAVAGASLSSKSDSPFELTVKSDNSSFDKPLSSKEVSTVNIDTPPHDENWGMSPIAPSASPHSSNFTFSDSAGDASVLPHKNSRALSGTVETPSEEELDVSPTVCSFTPHSNPSSLTPILRSSATRQSSRSSKKLNVSFSPNETSLDGKSANGKVMSSTPLSEVSNDSGLKHQVKKKQRMISKKPVLMKTAPASSASSKVTTSSNSSRSSGRSRSTKSKSPAVVDENDLDFNDLDEIGGLLLPSKRKTTARNIRENNVNRKLEDDDSAPPLKKTRTAKRVDERPAGKKAGKKDQKGATAADNKASLHTKRESKHQNEKKRKPVSK